MILPVVLNDGQGPPSADTITTRLAALSEIVLQLPNSGGGAGVVSGYKTFLSEFGCRVGPFDVLAAEDREAKASVCSEKQRQQQVGCFGTAGLWCLLPLYTDDFKSSV